jgi:DNA-binding MarR family transcriptional regulator
MTFPAKISLEATQSDILGLLLVDAARLLRAAFDNRINEMGLGLTPGEARALINIADHQGSRQLDIASRMGVEPMTLCTYLDKLQAVGLIERHICSADRRAKRIALTPASDEMVRQLRLELHEILGKATSGMSPDKRRALETSLAVFSKNLQEVAGPPASQQAASAVNDRS